MRGVRQERPLTQVLRVGALGIRVERELNVIASDDEPLVPPIFARNGVPRINATEPATVQHIESVLKVEDSNAKPNVARS